VISYDSDVAVLSLSQKALVFYIFVELCSGSLSRLLLGALPSGFSLANIMLVVCSGIVLLECRVERGYWLFARSTLFHVGFLVLLAMLFIDGFIERSGYSKRFFISGSLAYLVSLLVIETVRDRRSLETTLSALVTASLVTCGLSMLLALPLGLESYIPHTSSGQSEIAGGALGLGVNRQVTFSLGPDITAMLAICSVILLSQKWDHGWLLKSHILVRGLVITIFVASVILGQSRGAYVSSLLLGMGFVTYKVFHAALTRRSLTARLFILGTYFVSVIIASVGVFAIVLDFTMDRELARNFLERSYYVLVAGKALIAFPFTGTSNEVLGGGHPHNAFLQVAITLGFPGLIALFIWILHFFSLVWSRRFNSDRAVICIFLGFAVFLQNNFYIGIFQKITMIILSLAICTVFIRDTEHNEAV
jgi:hypothetical protein